MVSTASGLKRRHLLIVDDDIMMQNLLVAFLEQEDYEITGVTTGKEMLAVLNKTPVDLILLDLTLPDEDGLTLARQIRARSTIPIIIMTARLGMEDRLAGLEIGADDFLTKPFDPRELVFRVRNVLKRADGSNNKEAEVAGFDGWILNISARTLTAPDGGNVKLTSGEFNLLTSLVKASNRVLSRDQLLDAVARDNDPPSDRMVDVFVSRLRKKIEKNPRNPDYIVTVPGHGYKFAGNLE